jgi:protoheme IX farnesyltransferase
VSAPARASAVEHAASAIRSASPAWADYLDLTKPRITGLVLVTTLIGFFMGTRGPIAPALLVHTLLATAFVAAGASVLNQYLERDLDGLMRRTKNRPLPRGRILPIHALAFGVGLSAAGVLYLTLFANLLAGTVAAITVASYVFVYTPLKRVTPLSTLIGAVPGALPPLGGWAAATGSLGIEPWVLFGIVFVWQLPHFLAIGWMYKDDYSRAGFPMIPVLDKEGYITGRHMLAWSVALLPVSLMPSLLHLTGVAYFVGALVLGLLFLLTSLGFILSRTESAARRLFLVSILYLPLLWGFMVLDKAGL